MQSDYAAVGGLDGKLDIWSAEANKVERSLDIGEPITATVWTETKVALGTAKGSVKVIDSGKETATFTDHAGPVTGLALHPGRRILASVGVDKSFVFYDLESLERVSRVYTDSGMSLHELPYFTLTRHSFDRMCIPTRWSPLCCRHSDWRH